MKTISISGEIFEVSAPYVAGHVLNEAEAKALNQTRAENIGNNFRADVKSALAADLAAGNTAKLDALRKELDKYDAEYAFSMTTAREPVDPIEAEAYKLAKEVVRKRIAESKGLTVKKYLAIDGNQAKYDAAVEKVMTQEDTLKLAKKRVADKKKIPEIGAGESLGLD
jgi:hypothetical protein